MNNPNPNLVVEALRRMGNQRPNWCDGARRYGRHGPLDYVEEALKILPHAEAIAKMWPKLLLRLADVEEGEELGGSIQELIAAAKEHITWHGSTGHERLRAALKNLEEGSVG